MFYIYAFNTWKCETLGNSSEWNKMYKLNDYKINKLLQLEFYNIISFNIVMLQKVRVFIYFISLVKYF